MIRKLLIALLFLPLTASLAGAAGLSLFSIPFIAGEIFGLSVLVVSTSPLYVAALFILAGMNVLFYHLLKAPTLRGRELLDRIEGFKMYLATAEKDRLNLLIPPVEKKPELFEKYLPYALALDVEQEWAEQFAEMISRARTTRDAYRPGWYSGSSFAALGAGAFASSIGSSLSGAISSSSAAPGSNGGGGGSGGGGGGGGGGW